MLSSLFSERSLGGGLIEGPTLLSRPPAPRPPCNLVGLDNQGSTCYLNSLIQQLFQTPEVLTGLFALTPEALGADGPEESMRRIPLELQRLFARMLISNEVAVSTEQLTRSFGWTGDETFQQHDVQELNRILFAAIEASLVGLPGSSSSLIRSLYHGTLVNQVTCHQCGKVSEREEDYQDLCVPVAGFGDLTSSLIAAYVQCEVLEGDNAYRCEQCASLVSASKGTKIRVLPPILTISLLRFNFDLQRLERYKETGNFEFPLVLDMAPFEASGKADPESLLYDLVGVVIHRGSTYGGHYHAYIRDILNIGNWTAPEEEPIRMVSDEPRCEVETPQELITIILGKAGREGLQIGKLGGDIMKMTGSSWNGRFRSQHGPLVKFIKRHDHLWGYNAATQWVWLLESEAPKPKTSPDVSMQDTEADVAQDSLSSDSTFATASPAPVTSTGLTSAFDDAHRGWFDFNDAHVNPIRSAAIATQFSGRESAYLLTYRSRALRNEAPVQPPEWLRAELEQKNAEWEKQREDYDFRINAVTLHLLREHHVRLSDGELELLSEPEPPTVRVDWREPLEKLLGLIPNLHSFKSLGLLHKGMDIAYYVKVDLKSCDVSQSLKQLGVGNGAQLLLWDGEQLNGEPWPHARQKPFKILAECSFFEPQFSMRVHGVETPLSECLRQHWCDCDVTRVRVSHVTQAGREACMRQLTSEDLAKTAAQLDMKGDVHLLLSDINLDLPSSKTTESLKAAPRGISFTVFVRNCLAQDDNPTLHHVSFDSSTTVLEFRKAALQCCGFSALDLMAAECRLRLALDNDGSMDVGPPLIDDCLVVESGIDVASTNAHVILERGPPVPADHIFVSVVPWNAHGECSLVVSRELLLKDLKASASSALLSEQFPDLTPDQVSLQLLSWCDAPTRSFRDEEQTVRAAQLSNGDRLMLSRDKVLPKGMINIPLRSRRITTAKQLSPAALQSKAAVEAVKVEEEMSDLGELTIGLDATVGQLKEAVRAKLCEQGDGSGQEVDEKCMRLRAMEEGVLRAVLKSANQSVQRARLSCTRPLCAEILSEPQELTASDLLLAVRLREDETSSYSPPFDFVFPTPGGASPATLHEAVRAALGSERPFRLAKRMTNRRRWLPLPLDDVVSNTTTPGKRRTLTLKVSLLRAPYGLRDGDVIGVKFVEDVASPVTAEDFDTSEDLAWRQQQEEEAAERRNRRSSGSSSWFVAGGAAGGHRSRGPEVPLVIHVQKF